MDARVQVYSDKMQKAFEFLEADFAAIRAGRANPHVLDKLRVDYYGTPTPIQQVGNVTVPEARIIQIAPWEKSLIKEIEKAIMTSDIGINPSNDGSVIRLVFPELTEERRKDLVKEVKKKGEKAEKAARKERLNLRKMKHRIPCFIPVGRIGDGIDYNSCTVEDEYTMIKKVYLAIEITNNNFAPAYCKGDRILLENRFPELGECAVFTDGMKAYFRYFKMEGEMYCLKCLNGRGKDMLLRRMDEVDCLGTCISVIRK